MMQTKDDVLRQSVVVVIIIIYTHKNVHVHEFTAMWIFVGVFLCTSGSLHQLRASPLATPRFYLQGDLSDEECESGS